MLHRGSARLCRIAADKKLKLRAHSYARMLVVLCAVLLALSACAKQVAPSEEKVEQLPPPPPPMVEHTVQYSGETLGLIARWYTGKSSNWEAILATNPSLDPRRMKLGTVLSIPHELVVTAEPMPKEYVRSRQAAGSPKQGASTASASEATKLDTESSPSEEAQDTLTAEERLRRDLEAALAAEVAEDDKQEAASEEDAGVPSPEPDLGSASEDVDRERLLDELLGE